MNNKSYFLFPSITTCNALSWQYDIYLVLLNSHEVGAMIIPTLQLRKN